MNPQAIPSDELVREIIDDGKVTRLQIAVVVLCFVFNMLDGFDITAMAVVAGSVASELGLPDNLVGWIFGFATAGMMAGAMLLAPVSDIIGRRQVIIVSILLVGASIVLTAGATSFNEFIILRFISGVGAGGMLASQATLAAEYSPEKYRALSVAIVTSGYPTGAMFTSVAAEFIMPGFGWRGMFIFGGGLTLLMVVLAVLFIPESLKFLIERRPARALSRINDILAKLGRRSLADLPELPLSNKRKKRGIAYGIARLLHPRHRETTLILWTTFFLSFSALYFLLSWIPKLMENAGYSHELGRRAFFLFNLGGVIGIHLLGILSTRWKLTNIVAFMLVFAAIGMAAFAAVPDSGDRLLAIIFVVGVLQQGGFTGLYSAAAKAYPTEIRSTGVGWGIGLGRFGAVAGPILAGYLIAAGLDMSGNFYAFAVPLALSGVFAYRLHIR